MPAQNKTSLGLNQWEGNEYPKRIDFVEDNKIIDDELIKKVEYTDITTEEKHGIAKIYSENEGNTDIEKIKDIVESGTGEERQSLGDGPGGVIYDDSAWDKLIKALNHTKILTIKNVAKLIRKVLKPATDNQYGLTTNNNIRNLITRHAPKPDLTPYVRFDNSGWHAWSGRTATSNLESFLKGSVEESWGPANHHMYRQKGKFNSIEAYATLHVGLDRMYYKHSGRNGGNFNEIMDNHDMAIRDSRMNGIDTNIQNMRVLLQDVITWHVREIRLAGYVQGIIYHHNVGIERNAYVVTGVVQNTGDQIPDIIQMRALQFYRNGHWLNVPFA